MWDWNDASEHREKRRNRSKALLVRNLSNLERSPTESPVDFQFVDWKMETKGDEGVSLLISV